MPLQNKYGIDCFEVQEFEYCIQVLGIFKPNLKAKSINKMMADIKIIDRPYESTKPIVESFMKDRNEFVHYTSKLKGLIAKKNEQGGKVSRSN